MTERQKLLASIGLPRYDQAVPVCDCITTYKGESLHRPGCPR